MAADPTQLGQHIEFVNAEEQALFAEAMLGEEVVEFLNSNTGRYLHGRAKNIFDESLRKLYDIDPYSPEGKKEHSRLKMEAACAERFMMWCADVIQNGRTAGVQLENYRNDE